ncbi:Hypothetical protein KNT65_gp080 [Escherichia phage EcS1]|uniref:Uncharacterized protein n=1 Tax=Escherichia phage EcS1 TaxID=2083276 RepID=A0A2Z5ZBZ8_9CAUD|nr:Hypothetical protein KNT65_gp080 [Escherichia phage EcS1]BBC78128.1 Hypothetical protein [Escherichia phage EcS1]
MIVTDKEVLIKLDELERLQKIESLLWEVECALPSGLESWIDDEELQKLRG